MRKERVLLAFAEAAILAREPGILGLPDLVERIAQVAHDALVHARFGAVLATQQDRVSACLNTFAILLDLRAEHGAEGVARVMRTDADVEKHNAA